MVFSCKTPGVWGVGGAWGALPPLGSTLYYFLPYETIAFGDKQLYILQYCQPANFNPSRHSSAVVSTDSSSSSP